MLNSTQLRRLDMVGFYPWEAEKSFEEQVNTTPRENLLDLTASDMQKRADVMKGKLTAQALESVMKQIYNETNRGYKKVEVCNSLKCGNVDVDWVIKQLRTKGFDVTIKRTKFMVSDVNSLIIKW